MKRKVNKEDFNNIIAGDVLYKYPISVNEEALFNDSEEGEYVAYIVAEIEPTKYISFQESSSVNYISGYLTVIPARRKDINELLDGFWWVDDEVTS